MTIHSIFLQSFGREVVGKEIRCMKKDSEAYIIVPSYNEEKVIRTTILELLGANYKVIVVDDASEDDTYTQLQDLEIHYIKHRINLGQGAALQTGMDYAKKIGAELVVHFDADGQHNVEDLKQLIHPILNDEADIVLGSRFQSQNQIPFFRKILLKQAIWINGLLTGLWLSDAHNGLRALNKKALEKIELKENGMAHATEILMEIRSHRLRYREVPVHIHYSSYSQAKGQSIWNAFNILSDILLRKLFS